MRTRRPRPRPRGLRLAAWAADYAYAARQQVRHALTPPRLPRGGGQGAPVLLLPGIYEPWDFLRPVAGRLAARGHRVHAVEALGRNAGPVPAAAQVVAAYLTAADLRDVVIVAHSKGGLIGKSVMLGPAGDRIAGMVAFATPFAGSALARYAVRRPLRAFDPRNPDLRHLAAQTSVNERIVALYPWFDPHIPGRARLRGARNLDVPLAGHFRPLGRPLLIDTVVREVDRIAAASAAEG
ncbi:esterase/lipase family protein [Xylanimonas ulmi]|uniref:Alpha/beta hydrolase family protein n=1 Tax=Xylanimonas ulmi TaxID=228973 RepID=A0A4Q7M2N4_9MICO|nr:alpha/beta fold hydrolase [Xylanibacterium ulmi]RZS60862.1 alpha/beta hydrolase family protein [Xylanibacterium ulmi]